MFVSTGGRPCHERIRQTSEELGPKYHVSFNMCVCTQYKLVGPILVALYVKQLQRYICTMRTYFAGELSTLTPYS